MGEVDGQVQIWRYMDMPKFLSMLDREALYLCRADLLGDKFEGSVTQATLDQRAWIRQNNPTRMSQHAIETWAEHQPEPRKFLRKHVFVNCWHMGAHESMAMWRGSGRGNFGLAIQSTRAALERAISEAPTIPGRPIRVDAVIYGDYNSADQFVPNEPLGPFLFKGNIYSHESELRALFFDPFTDETITGIDVKIGLSALVQSVVVSPLAPAWYEALVRSTCRKLGRQFDVRASAHSGEPKY
jgi:hypothetical protein